MSVLGLEMIVQTLKSVKNECTDIVVNRTYKHTSIKKINKNILNFENELKACHYDPVIIFNLNSDKIVNYIF